MTRILDPSSGTMAWLRAFVSLGLAVAVLAIALGLRLYAIDRLPIDFDEDDYVRAGQLYAEGFRDGDLGVLLRENYRTEHPPLSKIVTGVVLAPLDPAPLVPDQPTTAPPAARLPQPQLDAARTAQGLLGALAAFVLALVDPVGGLVLAVHTWSIKYTSQVMLEAAPAFAAVVAALFATLATRARGRWRTWASVAAAVAFGLACAGKYLYGVVGLAIAVEWLWRTRPATGEWRTASRVGRWVAPVGGWLVLAVGTFLLADPYLWPDPVGRLGASLAYHGGYATSEAVQQTGWPMWQPLVWLLGSVPWSGNDAAFLLAVDLPIGILAAIGFRRLWSRHRVFALWLILAFAFLLAWPTKWPQYVLVLSAPLGLSAGHGLRRVFVEPLGRFAAAWLTPAGRAARRAAANGHPGQRRRGLRSLGEALPWLAPGTLGLIVLVGIPLLYEGAMSLTDLSASSLRDGFSGGVLREAVGGLTGQTPQVPLRLAGQSEVGYVGFDLLGIVQHGFNLGFNSSAYFVAFSVLWMVLSVGLQAILGLALALGLSQRGVRLATAWRTLFILPWAIPEFVGAVAWLLILHPDRGFAAQLAGESLPWQEHAELAWLLPLLIGTWVGFPLMMLVGIAGLRTIPASLQDAAALDGAGRWARFRNVTLPLLMPLLAPALLIRGIAAFNQFYVFYVLGVLGGRVPATMATFSFYIFSPASGRGWLAVSAAINLFTIAALAVLVAWFVRWRANAERFVDA